MDRIGNVPWLGGDVATEHWRADGSARFVTDDDDHGAVAAASLCVLSHRLPADEDQALAEATGEAYLSLLGRARELGYPWLLRTWHFVPDINRGSGDGERYRQFCLGRDRALAESGFRQGELGAATAVGSQGRDLRIHCLMGRAPGEPIENPRQVAAYRYPRVHGPRPPAFARAVALPLTGGDCAVMISGTASIVGHETMHPGDTPAQLEETIANLESLLGEAARRLERPRLAQFDGNSLLRIYVRRSADWANVWPRLRRAWPNARLTGLQADICRRELMVEIEAFHRG
jgi:chorismate lyase/3-hydroxybenzoate synthase